MVIKWMICACRCCSRTYIFPQHFRASRQRYSCISTYISMPRQGCTDVFRPCFAKTSLGNDWIFAICTNYDRTSNMRRLVCIFPLLLVSLRRNLITTAISITEPKWLRLFGRKVTFWPLLTARNRHAALPRWTRNLTRLSKLSSCN